MKALAEQVGEEVMGYTMKWVDGSDWNQEMPLNQRDDWGYATLVAEDDDLRFEWAPDENVNDWWELVEKMKADGWLLLFMDRKKNAAAQFFRNNRVCHGQGGTAFEATCHAALVAVRNE